MNKSILKMTINFSMVSIFLLLTTSCGSVPSRTSSSQESCPRQPEFDAKLKQIEPVIDSMVPGPNTTISQAFTCTKQKYGRAGYEIVVFIKPDGSLGGTAQMPKTFEIPAAACLQEAVDLLHRFKDESGINTMITYKSRFPELYADMDVGPVKWLVCSKEMSPKYYDGWATWIHENVHDLRQDNCLFNPKAPEKSLCFDMPSTLPDRVVAQITKMPTKNQSAETFLNSVQNTYLHGAKEPPVMLFDELNGYTQTLHAMSLTLKNVGPNGIYKNGERNVVLMPLFAVYSLNYLEYLRKNSPDDFIRLFGKGTANLENLKTLIKAAEQSYQEWKKENSCKTCTNNDFEDNLWNEFIKSKKAFF